MKNRKLSIYVILTSLGFIIAIGAGLFMMDHFNSLLLNFSNMSKETHVENKEKIQNLAEINLANIVKYVEKKYPVLNDPERLKHDAGTAWFWDLSDELYEISNSFKLPSIYFVEKHGDNFVSLLSSAVRRDFRSDMLLANVWIDAPPAFFNEAWETGKLKISPEPYTNEYGTFITAANPVIVDGKVVGILAAAYDISYLDDQKQIRVEFAEQEYSLLHRIGIILIIVIIFVIILISSQVWLSNTSVLVSAKEHKADELTRLMLESTPMLCALWDGEGIPIDCDEDTLKTLGISSKYEYFEHFFDLNPEYQPNGESSRIEAKRVLRKAIETGYERQEWMLRSAAGVDIPVEATFVRIPWKNDYCVAIYARDLREEKAKEAALKESEKQLRLILDSMSISCYFFDQDGNLLDCNKQAVALFGYEDKEELLKEFFYLSPEYQSDGKRSIFKAKEIIRETFASGKNTFLWEHIKKDGTLFPVEVVLKQVDWNDGYRVVAFLRDLSKIVETEDNLKRAQATVEASPNLIMFLGPGGNIEYMNPSVSAVSGFSREELQKNGLALLFSQENFKRLHREYISAALKRKNEPINFEMTVTAKYGEELDFSFAAYSVQLYDGSYGIGLTGRNITELKLMQRDLAIAKEQAERALESEKEYNKAKSDFLSRVSHELRTPLNAIIGVTHIAEKANEKAEIEKCCGKIREASGNLLWLVNDIVDITSYDTGLFEFTPQPFSFKKAMASVIENINARALAKKQSFDIYMENDITDWVQSDERRLKQVLLNLLINAVNFTPNHGKIQLSARELSNDGDECFIRFEVTDNGTGISPETLERLGEVFEQADTSITREHGGLGLGLSLVKRIVQIMRGTISAKSEKGKGTRFICDVCLGIAKPKTLGEVSCQTEDVCDSIDLTGKRILVVDDAEINREILKAMLEDTGAILHEASTGVEAVKMFSQDKYNLVLMDLHMPIMDGFTATRNIRSSQQPWARKVPVISVSAEGNGEIHSKCFEAGINAHITKPVRTESLFRAISKWIDRTAA